MERDREIGDQEIDSTELERELQKRNLAGMNAPIALLMELYGIDTYEELIPALQEKNAYGNFQLETTDISTYQRIMGTSTPPEMDTPETQHLVISHAAIKDTIAAIRDIAEEALKKSQEEETEEALSYVVAT